MDDCEARLTARLSHEGMTWTLIRAGALLPAYELIKLQIVNGVSDFYWSGRMNGDKKEHYPDYQADVVDRDKSLYRPPVAWLVESKRRDGVVQHLRRSDDTSHNRITRNSDKIWSAYP